MQESLNRQIADLIVSSNNILLITHKDPDVDVACSLAAFYGFLKEHFKKQVDICFTNTLQPRNSGIFAKANIQKESILEDLPQKNYTISIKREGEKIESVKFDNDESAFNFVITPFNGKLDLKSISITESGAQYDLIICFDIQNVNQLGDLYKNNGTLFDPARIVNFTLKKSDQQFAQYDVQSEAVQTISQLVLSFLRFLQVQLPQSVSPLLFAGIYSSLKVSIAERIKANTFIDLAFAAQGSINMQEVNDILYSPASLNEIFLIGDILDSSNEGEIELIENGKMIGCKISFNKEELDLVDMDKVAQIVFWNIKIPKLVFGYIIFQRSHNESSVFIQGYQHKEDVKSALQNKNASENKETFHYTFEGDMNQAEADIKNVFTLQYKDAKPSSFSGINAFNDLEPDNNIVQNETPFGLPPANPSPALPLFDTSPFTANSAFSPVLENKSAQQPVLEEKKNVERPFFDPRQVE